LAAIFFQSKYIFREIEREREIKTNKIKTINKKAGERKKRKKKEYIVERFPSSECIMAGVLKCRKK